MLTVKTNSSTEKLITSKDILHPAFSWGEKHGGEKLVTAKWGWGSGNPSWTCPESGTYFIMGNIAGPIGYYQLHIMINGNAVAKVGDFSPAVRGVMAQTSTLVHMEKGDLVKVYVHTDTAGIELDTDMWIYNLFVD